jgi:hypothetical protein
MTPLLENLTKKTPVMKIWLRCRESRGGREWNQVAQRRLGRLLIPAVSDGRKPQMLNTALDEQCLVCLFLG